MLRKVCLCGRAAVCVVEGAQIAGSGTRSKFGPATGRIFCLTGTAREQEGREGFSGKSVSETWVEVAGVLGRVPRGPGFPAFFFLGIPKNHAGYVAEEARSASYCAPNPPNVAEGSVAET